MCKDLGLDMKGRVYTDSSAAKGITNRRGLGKTKHIDTTYLWVQERLHNNDFKLYKERTDDNVGDLFTKHLDQAKLNKFVKRLHHTFLSGQSGLTLKSA